MAKQTKTAAIIAMAVIATVAVIYLLLLRKTELMQQAPMYAEEYTDVFPGAKAVADSVLRKVMEQEPDIEYALALMMDTRSGYVHALVNLYQEEDEEGTGPYVITETDNIATTFRFEPEELAYPISIAAVLEDGYSIPNMDAVSSPDTATYLVDEYYKEKPEKFIERLDTFYPTIEVDSVSLSVSYNRPTDQYKIDRIVFGLSAGYDMTLYPINILCLYNAIANHGMMVMPSFSAGQRSKTWRIMKETTADSLSVALCKTAATDVHCMLGVMPYQVAGKFASTFDDMNPTGYANWAVSFAGFFPADKPISTIFCLLITRRTQDWISEFTMAPVVREIITALYQRMDSPIACPS